ncbi:IclR family transcriptional regulator C-terminal domain-containing protein [Burkholderia gladioli]|uniref:IclR family transcriptional regulator domain-containing protein n=1 Tax=Burkholderia gladioli TaxID=28095 RepID=UPI0006270DCB|nr:IclR family transcriptional regulator C-terminal domain-containing protein [Burkholderia gladioli]KKJ07690.1 IclR family transcriptional regulator [Burkholderia gladioli]
MTSTTEAVNGREGALSSSEDDNANGGARAKEGMGGLAKGLAIIEAFNASTTRMTVSDAAHLAELSRPAARRCLLTLVDLGYLAHDGKFFTPLPRMLRLGGAYLSTSSLPQIAQPLLADARDSLQESISLAVLDESYSVFVARAEAVRIVSTGVKLGGRLPAYCSATGRVLLSGMSDEAIRASLDSVPMKRLTSRTLVSPEAVLKAIHRAAEQGYAVSDQELEFGMSALAVPVKNRAGVVEAAISVSVFSGRVDMATLEGSFLPALQATAKRLERSL